MRDLNECKAEVLRRAGNRIAERKKIRNRVLTLCVPLCLVIVISAVVIPSLLAPPMENHSDGAQQENHTAADDLPETADLDDFSFSLTWGCYGISSYDSATGKLVKTTDATHPEDYVTTYWLTDAQKKEIYDMIRQLNVTEYPDFYNPHGEGVGSDPSMTLILSVRTDTVHKTVTAKDIALLDQSNNPAGQKFLDICKAIEDILMSTDEWKALPDYEFYYD